MRLSITLLAAQDLEEIGDYIAQDNPSRAVDLSLSYMRNAKSFVEILRDTGNDLNFQKYCVRVHMEITCSFLNQMSLKLSSFACCMGVVTSVHSFKSAPEGAFFLAKTKR